ncbi:hypothetical protein ACMD2_16570 [Ananas comosus]|uniref:Uncharacterized protein n=1 Tax=Ananas comosus TaxID=4615 RepID=A0A199W838_ANACO|nr:hypothetical protein ACMD2_16570 [Ananas comosus]
MRDMKRRERSKRRRNDIYHHPSAEPHLSDACEAPCNRLGISSNRARALGEIEEAEEGLKRQRKDRSGGLGKGSKRRGGSKRWESGSDRRGGGEGTNGI